MKSTIKTKTSIVKKINKKVDELKNELMNLLLDNKIYIGKVDDWATYLDPDERDVERRMTERLQRSLADCIFQKVHNNINVETSKLFNYRELQEANKQLNDKRNYKKKLLASDEYKQYLELKNKFKSYDPDFYLRSY